MTSANHRGARFGLRGGFAISRRRIPSTVLCGPLVTARCRARKDGIAFGMLGSAARRLGGSAARRLGGSVTLGRRLGAADLGAQARLTSAPGCVIVNARPEPDAERM